jgi:aldehyde:ferredoxin oxidoreductase
MGIPGYGGTILYIDLTTGQVRRESLDIGLVRQYIGGWGLNQKLAYDLIPPKVGPLSPDNKIIIGVGPFVGTTVPGSSKLMVTTKLPTNGALATCIAGSLFQLMLKTSGYDHVVIGGRSEKPIYLKILDDSVELCDAADIWGKADIWQTVDILRQRHEPCSVIPIGPTGENLVPISATMVDKMGHLGSGGLPAVMGSKNLKAIVAIQGTKAIKIADRQRFVQIADDIVRKIKESPLREFMLREDVVAPSAGAIPIKRVDYANFKLFSPEVIRGVVERHTKLKTPLACAACPAACKGITRFVDGAKAGKVSYCSHHYFYDLGAKDAIDVYDKSSMYDEGINRYGLDLLGFRDVISIAASLYERGLLTKEDTGGLEIKDDLETIMKLMRMIAYREGFGNVLAEGMVEVCRRIGKGTENYVLHTRHRAFCYDPRIKALGTFEFNQLVDPRGGMIREASSPTVFLAGIANASDLEWGNKVGRSSIPAKDADSSLNSFIEFGRRIAMPEEAIKRIVKKSPVNVARYTKHSQDWHNLLNFFGTCSFTSVGGFFDVKTLADLYTSLTGIDMTPSDLMKTSERCFNLYKVLNVRAGFGREEDNPPEIWFTPLKDEEGKEHPLIDYCGNVLTREDVSKLIDDYYDERGWDVTTGAPTPQKLKELGLEWVTL